MKNAKNRASIYEVKDMYSKSLMQIKGVNGVGISESENGEPCLKIYLESMTPEVEKELPKNLAGYKVEFEVIGNISAF